MTWIAVLILAWMGGRFLARTEILLLLGLGVMEAAAALSILSIVILPMVVHLHARLYWRDRLSLATHVSVGLVIPPLVLLIADLALPHFAVAPTPFLEPSNPVWLTLVVAAGIGGLSSALVRTHAIRLLQTRDAEIARRFD